MSNVPALLGIIGLASLGTWVLGGIVIRLAGSGLTIVGLLLAAGHQPGGLMAAGAGALAWIAGHELYALRHHTYKSPLMRRLHAELPDRLDLVRHWVTPTTTHDHNTNGDHR